MNSPIKITDERVFKKTKGVFFSDIGVEGSNALDLVEHEGRSVSPPNTRPGLKQWYYHKHQTDNNRVLRGERLFELFNSSWKQPHWFVFLDPTIGALEIPPRCYHRSISGKKGSLLINHAIRDEAFDESKEFDPRVIWKVGLYAPNYFNILPHEADYFIRTGAFDA